MTAATSERIVGGLLPGYLLSRVAAGDGDVPGTRPEDYDLLPSEKVSRVATRSWSYLREEWRDFQTRLERAGESHRTRVTRDWLLVLLRELGYAKVEPTPAGGLTADEKQFPVSHLWEAHVPVHLLGWDTDLDRRTPGTRGAATAAPQSMVQQVLNRSDRYLWAILSNGTRLRLLRDSTSLVGSAYLEFDLESMFGGEQYSDFLRLYLCCHASRLAVRDPETGPASCWMERWREYAGQQGVRALGQLHNGVRAAIELLGTGLTSHPANGSLRAALASEELDVKDFNRALLRLVYRLLFWFVTEDRGALLVPLADDATAEQRQAHTLAVGRYAFFSSARLRTLARAHRHSRHGDLWQAVQVVFDALGAEGGEPALALPGLGGLFDNGALDRPLRGHRRDSALDEPVAGLQLSNTHLLSAVEALSVVRDGDVRRPVDFQHLGARELGSVYEQLLELHPRYDPATFTFTLERLAGNERKTTGSYYTPESLVECLLDSALQPLIDEAAASATPAASLLDLTVCDPACGSGHFLIAAARRIAKALAAEEIDELEPSHAAVQSALRRVVARCIYGVDVNPMAVELAKVSLWLEALEPGKPLSFLNENIRIGNSLLGTTPKLLRDGIPDAAFTPLEGDDRKVVSALKKQNAFERPGQTLVPLPDITVTNTSLAKQSADILRTDPTSLADVHVQEQRAAQLEEDRAEAKRQADAWCAAFVQLKTPETRATAITEAVLRQLGTTPLGTHPAEPAVRDLTRRYRFFHWHIEFPHIFQVPEDTEAADDRTGWTGGFSCVLGNPPWERVKLQEQEFFAARDTAIASAPNAAARKKLIKALPASPDPAKQQLVQDFAAAKREAEGTSHFLRSSGRYPLNGRGDINTYAIFAESDRSLIDVRGRMGVIVPTGIATDATTQRFFRSLIEDNCIDALLDFVTNPRLWTDVGNRRYRFSILTIVGHSLSLDYSEFATLCKHPMELPPRGKRVRLTARDITKLSPNTGNCPMFVSQRDAEITLGLHDRAGPLWNEEISAGNPWNLSLWTMFHMANDSHLFVTAPECSSWESETEANVHSVDGETWLPLYEAKLVHAFDHRFTCYSLRNRGSLDTELPRLSDADKENPYRVPVPRYWVNGADVERRLTGRWHHDYLLGWREITNTTNERTLVATILPRYAVNHKFPLLLTEVDPWILLANISSFALDYCVRQKMAGVSLSYFILKQLPVFPPSKYAEIAAWDEEKTLAAWIAPRVHELVYTSYDLRGFAKDLGDEGAPFKWDRERRANLRAELDAAYFHLYDVSRDDVKYIMESFPIVRRKDEAEFGHYRSKELILDVYDRLTVASRDGRAYRSHLVPRPGLGHRHETLQI